MADAYSYLTGSTGDAYSRLYGTAGQTWARLPGMLGDAWERLIASIITGDLSCYLGVVVTEMVSWQVTTPAKACFVTVEQIKNSKTIS